MPGTIILFDEYFNYPNWEQHEFKAFQEFVDGATRRLPLSRFARQQVAVRIDAIGRRATMMTDRCRRCAEDDR